MISSKKLFRYSLLVLLEEHASEKKLQYPKQLWVHNNHQEWETKVLLMLSSTGLDGCYAMVYSFVTVEVEQREKVLHAVRACANGCAPPPHRPLGFWKRRGKWRYYSFLALSSNHKNNGILALWFLRYSFAIEGCWRWVVVRIVFASMLLASSGHVRW